MKDISKNPKRPPKKWARKMMKKISARRRVSKSSTRRILGHVWYHRLSPKKRMQIRKKEESRALVRNAAGSYTHKRKGGSMSRRRHHRSGTVLLSMPRIARKHNRKRRSNVARRRRHNPKIGVHRPRLHFSKSGWRRGKRSTLFTSPVMINPRRVRRSRRRNPNLMKNLRNAFSRKWLMSAVSIGGGVAAGFALKSFYRVLRPVNMSQYDNWSGVVNVIVGSLMFGMMKRKALKEIGVVVAGTGLYDLIASNVPMLGLPSIPAVGLVQTITGKSVAGSYATATLPVSPTAASSVSASYSDSSRTVGLPGVSGTALTMDPYEGIFN